MAKTAFIKKGLPAELEKILVIMGENCSIARKKRKLSMTDIAQKVFVTRQTVAKMEQGDPTVSLGSYITYAYVLGMEEEFRFLFAPERDRIGLALDRSRLSSSRKRDPNQPDLDF